MSGIVYEIKKIMLHQKALLYIVIVLLFSTVWLAVSDSPYDNAMEQYKSEYEWYLEKVDGYCKVPVEHKVTLGYIVDNLYSFKTGRASLEISDMSNPFIKKLYATYLSYLDENDFAYDLVSHSDYRGSFTEFIHTINNGQVSINVSKPHIIKGQHWHHTKNEKFIVVSGNGVIRFRKIGTDKVIEYFVSGDKLQVVDIPTGYTHNIENLGDTDMVTIMWCNEIFDAENPDTYFEEV